MAYSLRRRFLQRVGPFLPTPLRIKTCEKRGEGSINAVTKCCNPTGPRRDNLHHPSSSLIWRERVEVERIRGIDNTQLTDLTGRQNGEKRENGESRHNLGTISVIVSMGNSTTAGVNIAGPAQIGKEPRPFGGHGS